MSEHEQLPTFPVTTMDTAPALGAAPPNGATPEPVAPAPAAPAAPAAPVAPVAPVAPTVPTAKPLFDLDALENERIAEPFVFSFGGIAFELLDPKDMDWQDMLIGQENPRLMMHLILPDGQRELFMQQKLSLRKMELLLQRWQQHFGVTEPGERAGSARS